MKLYLFENLDKLTERWHPQGGLVIIAKSRKQAEKMADDNNEGIDLEWDKLKYTSKVKESKPKLFIFPDAGCC